MIPYEDDIISVIDTAYKAGFFVPKYFFEKDKELVKNSQDEIYHVDPLYIAKPKGVEFSYVAFYNGDKLRGGYLSINNNYSGLQRGMRSRGGGTMFSADIRDVRVGFKKMTKEEPQWMAHSFVMDEKGKIVYFGNDSHEYYIEQIEKLAGKRFDELTDIFLAGEKMKRPQGFVSFLPVVNSEYVDGYFTCVGDVQQTVTKSWNTLYDKLDCLDKKLWYLPSVDSYIRKAYATMQTLKVLS